MYVARIAKRTVNHIVLGLVLTNRNIHNNLSFSTDMFISGLFGDPRKRVAPGFEPIFD